MEADAKLNLLVGTRCNNRCLFCLDRGGEALTELDGAQVRSREEAIEAMKADRERGATALAYGRLEVALDPGFPGLVRAARELGYTSQHLSTNGRVLSSRALVDELLEAGIDYVTLSIHAPEAAVHDRLAGRRGAFDQALRGIENLVAARRDRPLRLSFATTVTALNVHLLSEHYAFLQGFTPSYLGLNALLYSGRGAEQAEALSFPYAQLATELRRLLETHAGALNTRFAVVGVPYCALRELPPEIVGLREAFVRPTAEGAEGWLATGAAGEEGFALRHLPFCAACAMRDACPGLSEGYRLRHGEEGLAPLDESYRARVGRAPSVFRAGRFRYPVANPRALPAATQRLGALLQRSAGPEWRLAAVAAFSDERQVAFRLAARFVAEAFGDLRVDVAPRDPEGRYFATAGDWGLTLGDTGDERFAEPEAQARERLLARLARLLTKGGRP